MKYKTVIWDFDGTLADTLGDALDVYNQLAERHGLQPVDDPEIVRNMSMTSFAKRQKIPVRLAPLLVKEFLAAQSARISEVRLYSGVTDTLRALRDFGCEQGIVSSNTEDNIRPCLRNNGAVDYFRFIVGYSKLAGKRRALRRTIERFDLVSEKVVYIGDDVRDVQAAKAAGIDIVAVTWGISAPSLLASEEPRYLVESPAQLRSLIERGFDDDRDASFEK